MLEWYHDGKVDLYDADIGDHVLTYDDDGKVRLCRWEQKEGCSPGIPTLKLVALFSPKDILALLSGTHDMACATPNRNISIKQ